MGTPMTGRRTLAALVACLAAAARTAHAESASRVPPAYRVAAQRAGVPAAVLYAVALQESGAHVRERLVAWPWTINVAGHALRFSSRVDACIALHRAIAGTTPQRIDVGLAQINLGYQAQRYASACELLDPYRNLAVAAQILQEQHVPGGDWLAAVGRYHRPAGGEEAVRYRSSVRRLVRALLRETSHSTPSESTP